MKRSVWLPALLLIYLAVMSYIGWGGYCRGEFSAPYYFGLIIFTLVVIICLHLFLKHHENK